MHRWWSFYGCWVEDEEEGNELAMVTTPRGSLPQSARAQAELKFCYIVTAQIYGEQKNSHKLIDREKAADISYLMQM